VAVNLSKKNAEARRRVTAVLGSSDLLVEIFFDEQVKNAMRELWVRRKMKEWFVSSSSLIRSSSLSSLVSKKRYSHPAYHNIFCGTWNINGKERLTADPNLSDWLLPENHSPQDIYVLGFQEIVPLTPMNIAVDPLGSTRTQYWLSEIRACLQQVLCRRYRLVGAKNLVGILLCVFVDESLYGEITDVRWTTTAVGVMGVMGNKGAVIVRFNLHGTSLCFVCAHLAAARENVQARNTNYRNIMERSSLLPEGPEKRFPSFTRQSGQYGLLDDNSLCTILDHDLVFWIGDFNYRIDLSLSLEEIMSHICCENIAALRKKDQLTLERALGNVFQGFEEAPLTFLPSYKFIAGTDVYDTRPERKLRPPAWCDRVLWKDQTLEGLGAVTPKAYRKSKLKTSDHKPVSGSFLLETRVVDCALERLEYERLLVEVGSLRSGTKPEVEIAPLEFHVPRIRFMVPPPHKLSIPLTLPRSADTRPATSVTRAPLVPPGGSSPSPTMSSSASSGSMSSP
jgi:inositol polyphosphate 5-phosphatase INPP5B/F